ncbi:hypothetical protein [Embleya sp. NPDC005575]|uniref:hypothetical protein n=1 Tax=Embleya sp. NPDC005575 TaxID=3156892 RepID=UPI00339E25BF
MFIGYAVVSALFAVVLAASAVITITRQEAIVAQMRRLRVPDGRFPGPVVAKVAARSVCWPVSPCPDWGLPPRSG